MTTNTFAAWMAAIFLPLRLEAPDELVALTLAADKELEDPNLSEYWWTAEHGGIVVDSFARLIREAQTSQGKATKKVLRHAENVSIYYQPGGFTGKKGWEIVSIGNSQYRSAAKTTRERFEQAMVEQRDHPVQLLKLGERRYWMFQDKFYWENEDLTTDQVYALIVTKQQRRQRQIKTAQQIVAVGSEPRSTQRIAIPDDVKHLVWIRDGGRCRNCNATSELQYDHIIPVSLGGSSEAENVQILCGPCNRRKSAGLTLK